MSQKDIVFYDGECALCHGFVLFILKRDRSEKFHYAPLQGETFRSFQLTNGPEPFPDSIAYRDKKGRLYYYSEAVIRILGELPVQWKILARALSVIPKFLRDWGYRMIARVRKSLFGRKADLCPVVPPELRQRFLP